jgi:[glutamine synthetase] adenylyltransferase / [glutamine synthetase]-adenylyl-L-tyrosine phosphorylase
MTFDQQLNKTFQGSRYAERLCTANRLLIDELRAHGNAPFVIGQDTFAALPVRENKGESSEEINTRLRRLRQRVMLRLIFRDLNGLADLDEVVTTISALADFVLAAALNFHTTQVADKFKLSDVQRANDRAKLVIVGMGKLGAHELNVSSDIDLIFIHAEDGEASAEKSWHEFHSEIGKRVIRTIDDVTQDGFVFRVDMRLRPYGASGALVSSLAALNAYFRTQARPWERYAWLKARAITGATSTIETLFDLVTPFVYRRYHDYGAIDEMRDIHGQIRAEATKRNRLNDIKVGPGGIREVEFVVQMQQLIRGGREPRLQIASTRDSFAVIASLDLMDAARVARLREAYVFLRNLEHRLQYVDDAQTQALPTTEFEQARIAHTMNFADWAAFDATLKTHREIVTTEFENVFAKSVDGENSIKTAPTSNLNANIHAVFEQILLEEASKTTISTRVAAWTSASRTATLSPKVRARMETLIPAALRAALAHDPSTTTAFRMFDLLDAIDKRETYLALLSEHPDVLNRVARIAAKSAWAADFLRKHPVLLDELLNHRNAVIDWLHERENLDAQCARLSNDTEALYELLRHTKQVITLKLNIADIEGRVGVMALSDGLSMLADMLLEATLNLAWQSMKVADSPTPNGFAIIGYGKLGSKELGYASDLDLVFLYDENAGIAADKYAKLAQRLSSWLNTMTAGGVLYETDLRLRPDGASGMLVSSLNAFRDYQFSRAWTWEHQALTRARWCAGDATLNAPFDAIRNEVLSKPREREKLRQEIIEMRDKMRAEKDKTSKDRPDQIELKHTRGGIVDVEFIVQYLILAYSHEHPDFLKNLGNFALLMRAGALGILDEDIAAKVAKAYLAYREQQHLARNNNQLKTWVAVDALADERHAVIAAWSALFG